MSRRGEAIKDVSLNMISFGLIIGVQQLLVMPIVAHIAGAEVFAQQILYVTFVTIVVNVTGVELGNMALARASAYTRMRRLWDFGPALPMLSLFCAAVVFGLGWGWQLSPIDGLGYAAVAALGVLRAFTTACLRYRSRFGDVVGVGVAYAVGAAAGLWWAVDLGWFVAPFLAAEVAAIILLGLRRPFKGIAFGQNEDAACLRESIALFLQLAAVSLLMNFVSYFDRLLALPLLGASALAIYYAASVVAKSMSLLTNPVAATLLARLADLRYSQVHNVKAKFIRAVIPFALVSALINLGAAVLGLRFLYPTYYSVGIGLVVPIALGAAMASSSDLLRPLLIRFYKAHIFLFANLGYAVIFGTSVFFFSHWWGLPGFAWATAVGRATQLCAYAMLALFGRPRSDGALREEN